MFGFRLHWCCRDEALRGEGRSFGENGRTFNRRNKVQDAENLGMWAEVVMGGNSRLGEEQKNW